jgi:hypothetical protein
MRQTLDNLPDETTPAASATPSRPLGAAARLV